MSSGSMVYVSAEPATVYLFNHEGSFEGKWGKKGSGDGEFAGPPALATGKYLFAADSGNERVQYFSYQGSFLGKWGKLGTGPGEFKNPGDIAVSPDGERVYVADYGNNRIQYFIENVAITPASLGRVKALFK